LIHHGTPCLRSCRHRSGTAAVWMLLALAVLGGCVSAESWEATRVLADIDAGAGASALKDLTPTPSRRTLRYSVEGRPGLADLYEPHQPTGGALVLVPGFTEQGKNDRRVVELARSLSRARFLVLVPEVPGSRQSRVRLEDARVIADAVVQLRRQNPEVTRQRLGVVAISYAVGLAVLATQQVVPEVAPDFLVGVGGYYDTGAVVTFATTGKYRLPGATRWRSGEPLPAAKWIFLASNAAVLENPVERRRLEEISQSCLRGCDPQAPDFAAGLGPEGRSLLALITNTDPDRVPQLLAELPESVTTRLKRLSLRRQDLSHLAGRLILIHGRLDPLIPYSESLALSRAVPGSELFLIDGFSHIAPRSVGWAGQLQLIDAIQAVLRRRSTQ